MVLLARDACSDIHCATTPNCIFVIKTTLLEITVTTLMRMCVIIRLVIRRDWIFARN